MLILLLLALGVTLTLPRVQSKLAAYLTEKINSDYHTDIKIDQVSITIFGVVKLKKVLIKDHHKDTLIYANRINTNILNFKKLIESDLFFGDVRIDGFHLNMKTYKKEKETNLDQFIAAFDSGKPSTKKFLLTANNVYLTNSHFILIDENREVPKDVDFTKLNATLSDFKIHGPDVTTKIEKMSFKDHRGLFVKNLSSHFIYTKKHILLNDLDLVTNHSLFKGNVALNYIREDFKDFNNKVQFNILIDQASLATNDIRYFYKEIGKDQYFTLKAHVTGTLNDLVAHKMTLNDGKNSRIIGDVNFKNLFGKNGQHFYMKGDFKEVTSNYNNLITLLPNVLGKKLPSSLSKLGQFNLRGQTEITTKTISADFYLSTVLGNIQSNLIMTNIDNIDKASYKGNVILEEFNIGAFLGKKDLEKVTLNVDVDGIGFKQKYLNTAFSGDIYKIKYKDYTYTKIIVDGKFKNPIFSGKVFINDPNLFLDFDGFMNLERKDIAYNFNAKVDYANLKKMNFIQNDSISIFKGNIKMNILGNNLDDLKGEIHLTEASYQNNKDTYYFDDFSLNSSFDSNNIRKIALVSPDIIEGEIVGKYQINELKKIFENSLGSLYANYVPNKIKKGQYLKFHFTLFNKIIEVFYPEIKIATNTSFKGTINSDLNDFKFNFISPNITAYENSIYNINIDIDNKNPLFNAYVAIDSIQTKKYKISDFSLINVTSQDTLFLHSEFKGGNLNKDLYSLNLYHTIDPGKKSVVGFQKSELKFNDFLWYINEEDNNQNKIVFDKTFKNFSIDNLIMSNGNQKMELFGELKDKTYKDLKLNFKEIQLDKFLPAINNFKIVGKLNGEINLKQNNSIYLPTATVKIDSLNINKIPLGNLKLKIDGDDSFKKFNINSSIENDNIDLFTAIGDFNIVENKVDLDLDLNFDNFNIGLLQSFGGDIISNIRGFVSGRANLEGPYDELEINGRLFLKKAGLGIPYLNVDYKIEEDAIVDVTERKFLIRNATLEDTKYNTRGKLNGEIGHSNFSNWKLDLSINSNRILVLDTQDSEDAAYFGTAFIDGNATLKGPTNALFIKVDAKSEKGTEIKIPINEAEGTGNNAYIHFINADEKFNFKKGIKKNNNNYNGLELEFDLAITDDAEIEVILDRNSGHGMKGKGFGSILLKINTLGKFNMWGDFQAYEGSYNFKYGSLINKKFDVKKGGSITWEGDPMRANLNLEAMYTVPGGANPGVLIENPSFNRKVPVTVLIGLKGSLSNPEPNFDIEFPTVNSILKSELQTKLDDNDFRQRQALILLSTGGFLSPEGVSQSSITNNLYEKVGDLFGSILNDKDGKFTVGVDLVGADNNPNSQSDGRFGVNFSTNINERISINGKLGVPVGGINESAVVGDVEVQYRVNKDGTLNLRVFNKENDINYIGQGIGYTQGLGITYEVDFDTFKELLHKIFKKQKIEIEKTPLNDIQDSSYLPDNIKFKKDNKKKKEKTNINNQAIPTDD